MGKVVGIYIAEHRGDDTVLLSEAHVVPGYGIQGDRYFNQSSNPDKQGKGEREITLIEAEAIEYLEKEHGIQISPGQSRRNIITQGISLNELVGQLFEIGGIKFRGVRLCEPCQYLASRTDSRLLNALVHRGGLRSDILTEGIIHINDIINKI
jgi:MOSC domain-containing protein YiiM